ncbi:hypothetical protein B0H13DRAFT_2262570 [Mycena leptocephala]|nr:hypothetical protein B0H13DRAFT_2262570 [Mycena leptocephala]
MMCKGEETDTSASLAAAVDFPPWSSGERGQVWHSPQPLIQGGFGAWITLRYRACADGDESQGAPVPVIFTATCTLRPVISNVAEIATQERLVPVGEHDFFEGNTYAGARCTHESLYGSPGVDHVRLWSASAAAILGPGSLSACELARTTSSKNAASGGLVVDAQTPCFLACVGWRRKGGRLVSRLMLFHPRTVSVLTGDDGSTKDGGMMGPRANGSNDGGWQSAETISCRLAPVAAAPRSVRGLRPSGKSAHCGRRGMTLSQGAQRTYGLRAGAPQLLYLFLSSLPSRAFRSTRVPLPIPLKKIGPHWRRSFVSRCHRIAHHIVFAPLFATLYLPDSTNPVFPHPALRRRLFVSTGPVSRPP